MDMLQKLIQMLMSGGGPGQGGLAMSPPPGPMAPPPPMPTQPAPENFSPQYGAPTGNRGERVRPGSQPVAVRNPVTRESGETVDKKYDTPKPSPGVKTKYPKRNPNKEGEGGTPKPEKKKKKKKSDKEDILEGKD